MIRLAHIADLHLGSRARLTQDPRFAPLFRAGFEAMRDQVAGGGYDIVVVAGDLVDRTADDPGWGDDLQDLFDAIAAAGARAAVIDGNHDARIGVRDRLRLGPDVVWFDADEPRTVRWPDLGVAVHGCSVAEDGDERDLAARYPEPTELTDVALLHTSLLGDWSRRSCAPTAPDTLAARAYRYWALGHVHEHRVVCAAPTAAYSGSSWPLRLRDTGPHGVLEVSIAEEHVDVRLVETAPLRLEDLDLPAECGTDEAVHALNELRTRLATSTAWTIAVKVDEQLPTPTLAALHDAVSDAPRITLLPC